MYHVMRKDLYDHFERKGWLNEDHLFRVRRTFTDDRPPAENLVPGHLVGHKLNNPEFDIIEYYGPNERTEYEPTTLEDAAKTARAKARKPKRVKPIEEDAE